MIDIKPIVKIEPLYEDIIKMVGDSFFLSTAFKRWLVQVDFSEIWSKCFDIAERENSLITVYGDRDAMNANDTFILILNNFYENNQHENLVFLVKGILKTYGEVKKNNIDITLI